MDEVLVYQMGKCGSTAIVAGLRAAGIEAAHTHELGGSKLQHRVARLASWKVTDEELEHGIAQTCINIRLCQEMIRAHEEGRCVRMITLARHPVNWFWSWLIQNFDSRKHALVAADTLADFEHAWAIGDLETLSRLHRAVVESAVRALENGFRFAGDALAEASSPMFSQRVSLASQSLGMRKRQAAQFGFELFFPTMWFQEWLTPATGIDILNFPLSADGSCRITNKWFDLLVLSYERLASLVPVISEFVGRPVTLPVANSSAEKRYAGEVAVMRELVQLPDTLGEMLWSTPYCRHFGYGPGET